MCSPATKNEGSVIGGLNIEKIANWLSISGLLGRMNLSETFRPLRQN